MEDNTIEFSSFNHSNVIRCQAPIMKISSGIITNRGGRTCHASIVARELGIPAVVGTLNCISNCS